ncbi:hypothetical protein A2U01_0036253, partial [Trifolium medium]|nr:hypothetical protein [Trifolium medium]
GLLVLVSDLRFKKSDMRCLEGRQSSGADVLGGVRGGTSRCDRRIVCSFCDENLRRGVWRRMVAPFVTKISSPRFLDLMNAIAVLFLRKNGRKVEFRGW